MMVIKWRLVVVELYFCKMTGCLWSSDDCRSHVGLNWTGPVISATFITVLVWSWVEFAWWGGAVGKWYPEEIINRCGSIKRWRHCSSVSGGIVCCQCQIISRWDCDAWYETYWLETYNSVQTPFWGHVFHLWSCTWATMHACDTVHRILYTHR